MSEDAENKVNVDEGVECPKCHRPCAMWEIIEYKMCEFCYEYGDEAWREHDCYYDEEFDD